MRYVPTQDWELDFNPLPKDSKPKRGNETPKSVGLWLDTLPETNLHMQVRKLQEEVKEVEDAINAGDFEHAKEELADVVIVCFGIAFRLGMRLFAEVNKKMTRNRKRTWSVVNGVTRHIN